MPDDSLATILPLDPEDDVAFMAYAAIHRVAEEAGTEYPVNFQPAELRAHFRNAGGFERWSGYLGLDAARTPVVAGLLTTSMAANLEKATLSVWVSPDQRRRGYGSAMAEALVEEASSDGRTTLLAHLAYPVGADESHPHRRFAGRHGFQLSNSELHRVLDLPVPASRLVRLAVEAAEHHHGYQLVDNVDGDVPPDVLPSYLDLVNAVMVDAPTGDVDYEAGGMTPEMFQSAVALLRAQGRTLYRTIALDGDGRAAAYSMLAVPAHDPGKVFQFGTLVSRAHRGRRLGLAVKVRNVATMQKLHPDRSVVHTWNAASNAHMIAVNEAIGFRVVGETAEYARRLAD